MSSRRFKWRIAEALLLPKLERWGHDLRHSKRNVDSRCTLCGDALGNKHGNEILGNLNFDRARCYLCNLLTTHLPKRKLRLTTFRAKGAFTSIVLPHIKSASRSQLWIPMRNYLFTERLQTHLAYRNKILSGHSWPPSFYTVNSWSLKIAFQQRRNPSLQMITFRAGS